VSAQEHPYDRVVGLLRDRRLVRRYGVSNTRARCPAHGDSSPSLSVSRRPDKVLLRCFGGCTFSRVLSVLGLKASDTFVDAPQLPAAAPHVIAHYDYIDAVGMLVARKLRYSNKTFAWQHPVAGSWGWGLRGAAVGLYRRSEWEGARRVYVTEGEKSADRLWSLGLPATCGPHAAGTWHPEWSRDFAEAGVTELVVLPDNDKPGTAHAELVASITHPEVGASVAVKVLALPGLLRGADVFDWLKDGHTASDLEIAAEKAAVWLPGASERARLERKRAKNRERQKRWYDRHHPRRHLKLVPNAVNVQKREVA